MNTTEVAQKPKVGVGVLVFNQEGKVLLQQRKGAHGAGSFCGPGGHFEYMESFKEALKRETMEEAGVEIDNIQFLCLTNFKDHAPKHYVDIGFTANLKSGEPQVLEPDKCEGWGWYDLDNLPSPLFGVVINYIKAHQNGSKFYDN